MTAVVFSPIGNGVQFLNPSSGALLSGGLINTYLAGTTTPTSTYTTSAGTTPNANPIVLNANGAVPSEIWLIVGINYKFVITDSLSNTVLTLDNLTGIDDPILTGSSEWIVQSTPTFIASNQFSVVGNLTSTFDVGRRIKTQNTAGVVFSTIIATSYSGGSNLTTVTVFSDGTSVLDAGLSAVSVGFLDAAASSLATADIYQNNPVSFRNDLINSDMVIDQRQAATSLTVNNTTLYSIDRWQVSCALGAGTGALTAQQIQASTSGGSQYYLNFAVTTAKTSLSAGDTCYLTQKIIGRTFQKYNFGTANAKPVAVSFRFFSSIANAVVPITLLNGATNRSYTTSITTGTANVWATYSVIIPGDTAGTWATDSTIGCYLIIGFASGSTFQTPTPGTWQGAEYLTVSSATNFMSSVSNNWRITDVQLESGSVTTSPERVNFEVQLARCMVYFQKSYDYSVAVATVTQVGASQGALSVLPNSTYNITMTVDYKAVMRSDPTVTFYSTATGASGKARDIVNSADVAASNNSPAGQTGLRWSATASAANTSYNIQGQWTADADL